MDSQVATVNSKMATIPWINTSKSVAGRTNLDVLLATLPSGWGTNDNIIVYAVLGAYASTSTVNGIYPDTVLMCAGTANSANPDKRTNVYISGCYLNVGLYVSAKKVYLRVFVNNGGSAPFIVPVIGSGIVFNLSKL